MVSASLCNDSISALPSVASSGLGKNELRLLVFCVNFPPFTFPKKLQQSTITESDVRFSKPKLGILHECKRRNSCAQIVPASLIMIFYFEI